MKYKQTKLYLYGVTFREGGVILVFRSITNPSEVRKQCLDKSNWVQIPTDPRSRERTVIRFEGIETIMVHSVSIAGKVWDSTLRRFRKGWNMTRLLKMIKERKTI